MRLLLLPLLVNVVTASLQFKPASGACSGIGVFNDCDNSDIGGLCASASDLPNQQWCCQPEVPSCARWGQSCSGAGNVAGTGQIFCQNSDATQKWCCNAEYEVCTGTPNVFNLCDTNYANPYNDTSTAAALSLKAAYFATATTSASTANTLTAASTVSSSSTTTSTGTSAAATTSTSKGAASTTSSPSGSGATQESGGDGSKPITAGAIAGIVIGSLVAVAAIATGAFFLGKKRKSKAPSESAVAKPYEGASSSGGQGQMWSGENGRSEMVHEVHGNERNVVRGVEMPG